MSAFSFNLPKDCNVLVKEDSSISPGVLIAESEIFSSEIVIPVASDLGINPSDINNYLLKKNGDFVNRFDQIALKKGNIFKKNKYISSPVNGKLISINEEKGEVVLGFERNEYKLISPGLGKVLEIKDGNIKIDFQGKEIGLEDGGGMVSFGELNIISGFDEEVDHLLINDSHNGKILLGGIWGKIDLAKAKAVGVCGIIGKQIVSDFIKEFQDNPVFSIGTISEKNYSVSKGHNEKLLIIDGDNKLICLLK